MSIATASGGADSDLTSKGSILGSSKGYRTSSHSDDEVLFSRPEYSGSDDDGVKGWKIEDVELQKTPPYVPPVTPGNVLKTRWLVYMRKFIWSKDLWHYAINRMMVERCAFVENGHGHVSNLQP